MRVLLTEREIMQKWTGDTTKPLVSICCITFSQESYIEDTLEGFLVQETSFPFEILIHDDASTDRTTEIIREYEAKYPNLIKPIYQTVNQQSQGKRIMVSLFPLCKGEYIALCEGDDYWTDIRKLQVQVEAMRTHPVCNLCFHPAQKKIAKDGRLVGEVGKIYEENKIISAREILERQIAFMPTCSLLIKKEFFDNPEMMTFLKEHGTSFFLKLLPSISSGALYLNNLMSVYRVLSVGSHGQRVMDDSALRLKFLFQFNLAFDAANNLTDYKFDKLIRKNKSALLSACAADWDFYFKLDANVRKDIYSNMVFRHQVKTLLILTLKGIKKLMVKSYATLFPYKKKSLTVSDEE